MSPTKEVIEVIRNAYAEGNGQAGIHFICVDLADPYSRLAIGRFDEQQLECFKKLKNSYIADWIPVAVIESPEHYTLLNIPMFDQ